MAVSVDGAGWPWQDMAPSCPSLTTSDLEQDPRIESESSNQLLGPRPIVTTAATATDIAESGPNQAQVEHEALCIDARTRGAEEGFLQYFGNLLEKDGC